MPHSGYIPPGSLTNFGPVSNSSDFLNPFFTYWLCNSEADEEAYQVWLEYLDGATGSIVNNGQTGENTCTRIALETAPYDGPEAWSF